MKVEACSTTFLARLISMEAWLAGLVLIVVCAIGIYYLNNTVSGINDASGTDLSGTDVSKVVAESEITGFEGFTTALENAAESTCHNNYKGCITSASDEKACMKTFIACQKVAQSLNNVTTSTDPSGTKLSSQYASPSPSSKYLSQVMKNLPGLPDGSMAQGDQSYFDPMAVYKGIENRIRPHDTPLTQPRPLKATLASDVGTGADDGQEIGLTLRSQIRSDINQAVEEEIDDIDNEYLIKYD